MPQRLKSDQQRKSLEQEHAYPYVCPRSPISEGILMAVAAECMQDWTLASHVSPEAERLATERLKQFLGATAIRGEAELEHSVDSANHSTLISAIQLAALGDKPSRSVVETNVATDVGERMFKVAHQSSVNLEFSGGRLGQGGRRLTDIHRNTLEHTVLIPEMVQRAHHELKNLLVFEELYAQNLLHDFDVVIFSPTSTRMSDKDKENYGFFTDTETCSIQMLRVEADQAILETAFVAGKATSISDRHDLAAISKLTHEHGLELKIEDGTEALRYIILVPKSQLPNGVVDVVRLYDDAIGDTFYGEAKEVQDYLTYASQCEARNSNFGQLVEDVTEQLLAESHMLRTPLEAIMRLDEISERFCVKYSIGHQDINAQVFGAVSAEWIEQARQALLNGDNAVAERSLVMAQNTAKSGSCPLYKPNGNGEDTKPDSSNESSGKKMMNCPFCKARVYDDPCKKVLSCWDCNARVSHGRITSKGDGGARARAKRATELEKQPFEKSVARSKDYTSEAIVAAKGVRQAYAAQATP